MCMHKNLEKNHVYDALLFLPKAHRPSTQTRDKFTWVEVNDEVKWSKNFKNKY